MEKTAEEETEEFISNMLSEEDHKSLLEQSKEKLQLMKKFKESILYKDNISIDDFEMIKSFAVSKGGFITSDFRKILYKKIYCINNENKENDHNTWIEIEDSSIRKGHASNKVL